MDALAGPYLASAALLVVAGGAKLVDPLPLVRALRSARLPAPLPLVRAGAAGEVALGLTALATGARPAAVGVAVSFTAFSLFVLIALRRDGVLSSCGCFGKADTPPTLTHAVVTGGLAVAAVAVAVRPVGALPDLLVSSPGGGLPLLVVTAAVAVTGYLVLAVLPLLRVRT